MSEITSDLLQKVAPGTIASKRDRFLPYFNECLPRYQINNKDRVAAFLTTVCFESDYFRALSEYADGWAYDISRNRKKALQLGNTEIGDGPKYKGAGGIETTGKKNYRRLSDRLGIDFVAHPELLRTERYFVEAACVFWDDNHFNEMADNDEITLIENITNRGSGNKTAKALEDRLKIYHHLIQILPDDFSLVLAPDTPSLPATNEQGQNPTSTPDVKLPPTQAPNPPAVTENFSPDVILNKIDKAGDKWTALTAALAKFGLSNPDAARSKGTVIFTAAKSGASFLAMAAAFVTGHWEWLLLAAFLIGLAVYLWNESGKRAAGERAGIPKEVLTS